MKTTRQRAYMVQIGEERARLVLPTIAEVARDVFAEMLGAYDPTQDASNDVDAEEGESDAGAEGFGDDAPDTWCDVRLIFGRSNFGRDGYRSEWQVAAGLSDYDQWHGIACGGSGFDVTEPATMAKAREIAREIIDECAEQLAQIAPETTSTRGN